MVSDPDKTDLPNSDFVPFDIANCSGLCQECTSTHLEHVPAGKERVLTLFTTEACPGCDFFGNILEIQDRLGQRNIKLYALTDDEGLLNPWTECALVQDQVTGRVADVEHIGAHTYRWPNVHADGCFISIRRGKTVRSSQEQLLSMIRRMLAMCVEKHGWCHPPKHEALLPDAAALLPTRVIDVGTVEEPCIRLHLAQQGERGKYITLSHRWHVESTPRTTRDTHQIHLREISVDKLPKTYTDSIELARLLGVRYLWIDSLCIIQDCEQDWKEQSGLMSNYYGWSFCTFAATGAIHDAEGLWIQDPSCYDAPFAVSLPSHPQCHASKHQNHQAWDGTCESGAQSDSSAIYRVGHPRRRWPTAETDVLLKRGWCFQERLLSTRTIHFARDQVFYECHDAVYDQAGVMIPGDGRAGNEESGKPLAFKGMLVPMVNDPAYCKCPTFDRCFRLVGLWIYMVKQYTETDLTYPTDRLPALQGLVNRVSDYWEGRWRYSYGIWVKPECMFAVQFLKWGRALDNAPPAPVANRAPGWSWAAHDCRISWWWSPCVQRRFHRDMVMAVERDLFAEVEYHPDETDCDAPGIFPRLQLWAMTTSTQLTASNLRDQITHESDSASTIYDYRIIDKNVEKLVSSCFSSSFVCARLDAYEWDAPPESVVSLVVLDVSETEDLDQRRNSNGHKCLGIAALLGHFKETDCSCEHFQRIGVVYVREVTYREIKGWEWQWVHLE